MKIVHVNFSDSAGGAAIAVSRLHKLLLKEGIDSVLIVCENHKNYKNTISLKKNLFEKFKIEFKKSLNRKIKFIFKTSNNNTHSLNVLPSGILKKINSLNPDIVNLHWIGNETLSIRQISQINSKVVWTLHDMWPFCGMEHYTDNERFVEGYSKSNRPEFDKGIDLNKIIFDKKVKYYLNIKKIICSSEWMFECAKKSFLFKNKDIKKIPLLIDQQFWKPFNKEFSKEVFKIKSNEKVILFGAENFLKNKRKNFEFIKKIFRSFNFDDAYKIIFFGTNIDYDFSSINENIFNLGEIYDEYTLKLLYSASDVVVIPSTQEAFGQIAYEAIHCGTPCVAFANSGLSSVIDHGITGYLCEENNDQTFSNAIKLCLTNKKFTQDIISNWAKNKFDSKSLIKEYINFIKE